MKKIALSFLFQFPFLFVMAQLHVTNLLCENLSNPIGVDNTQPEFSWQLSSDKRNTMQTAYEVRVGKDQSLQAGKNLLWSSGKINSDESVQAPYKGIGLQPGEKYYWQVRVWDNSGAASAWS